MKKSKQTTFPKIRARRRLLQTAVALFVASPALPSLAASDLIRFENFSTHSRVIFRLDESIPSELKSTPGGFEIFFKGINLADLGAPYGDAVTAAAVGDGSGSVAAEAVSEVDVWKSRFSSLDQPRIASLKFTETNGGVKVIGKWRFPAGPDAPAEPRMEAFDYRDKTPAQYVIDFWFKKGPTVAQIRHAQDFKAQAEARRKSRELADGRRNRRLASDQARTEAYDIGRFCREPLRERSDIFLRLLPVHETVDFARWIPSTTPDSDFPYFEPGKSEGDGDAAKSAQYVRLALQLYREGKAALAIRTLDFFDTEQPRSEFRHEMKFLRANALLKLGHPAKGEEILAQLMTENKQSPEALHAAMFLAARKSVQRNHLAAFESFSWLITQHPEHRLAWLFHLGAAESLAGLKQTERAAKEYEWVLEHAGDARASAEAAARVGDIYLERFDYERALAAYSNALERYPAEMKTFPSVAINRAEALYHLGIAEREEGLDPAEHRFYERAAQAYDQFLKDYPSHPAGWRAAFRRGELDGRSLEPAKVASSRQFFYDTINHYPFSPGATLARLRLVPCGDHGGFTPESAQKFFDKEAAIFTGRGEVPTTHYREFRALAQVQALLSWDQEDRAVALLTQEIKGNPVSVVRLALERMYAVLFRKRIVGMIAEGKKYDALAFYDAKVALLPREARDFDPDYLLKLSQAASDLGFAKVAEELAAKYRKQTATNLAHAATDGRAPAVAPSGNPVAGKPAAAEAPDLYDRLQESESAFSEAKALWVATLTAAPATQASTTERQARVRGLLDRVASESAFSYEREIILGLIDEREKRLPAALAHAARAQVLRPTQPGVSGEALRIDAWLASLQARAGDRAAALDLYRSLETKVGATKPGAPGADPAVVLGVPPVPGLDAIIVAQAELYEKASRWGDAAAAYAKVMEAGRAGDQTRYGYANALLRTKTEDNRAKARKVLEAIVDAKMAVDAKKDEVSSLYRRLAKETLAHLSDPKNF